MPRKGTKVREKNNNIFFLTGINIAFDLIISEISDIFGFKKLCTVCAHIDLRDLFANVWVMILMAAGVFLDFRFLITFLLFTFLPVSLHGRFCWLRLKFHTLLCVS